MTSSTLAAQPGTVIILNGPSAAGKSSLQKKLQELFQEPYLKIGIDNFFVGLIPERYFQGPVEGQPADNLMMKGIPAQDVLGNPIFGLEIGSDGQRVIAGMHAAIGAYARAGNNVVVDYILYYPEWLSDLVRSLKGIKIYMIGIKPQLSVLEEREKARGTSPVGHARSHIESVHQGMIYDLELDTTAMSVEQAALKIKEYMQKHPEPTAFKMLEKKYS